jgi:hypothetical protein
LLARFDFVKPFSYCWFNSGMNDGLVQVDNERELARREKGISGKIVQTFCFLVICVSDLDGTKNMTHGCRDCDTHSVMCDRIAFLDRSARTRPRSFRRPREVVIPTPVSTPAIRS